MGKRKNDFAIPSLAGAQIGTCVSTLSMCIRSGIRHHASVHPSAPGCVSSSPLNLLFFGLFCFFELMMTITGEDFTRSLLSLPLSHSKNIERRQNPSLDSPHFVQTLKDTRLESGVIQRFVSSARWLYHIVPSKWWISHRHVWPPDKSQLRIRGVGKRSHLSRQTSPRHGRVMSTRNLIKNPGIEDNMDWQTYTKQ